MLHTIENPTILSEEFLAENIAGQKGVPRHIQSVKRKKLSLRIPYLASLSFGIKGEIRSFPRQAKSKGIYHY